DSDLLEKANPLRSKSPSEYRPEADSGHRSKTWRGGAGCLGRIRPPEAHLDDPGRALQERPASPGLSVRPGPNTHSASAASLSCDALSNPLPLLESPRQRADHRPSPEPGDLGSPCALWSVGLHSS